MAFTRAQIQSHMVERRRVVASGGSKAASDAVIKHMAERRAALGLATVATNQPAKTSGGGWGAMLEELGASLIRGAVMPLEVAGRSRVTPVQSKAGQFVNAANTLVKTAIGPAYSGFLALAGKALPKEGISSGKYVKAGFDAASWFNTSVAPTLKVPEGGFDVGKANAPIIKPIVPYGSVGEAAGSYAEAALNVAFTVGAGPEMLVGRQFLAKEAALASAKELFGTKLVGITTQGVKKIVDDSAKKVGTTLTKQASDDIASIIMRQGGKKFVQREAGKRVPLATRMEINQFFKNTLFNATAGTAFGVAGSAQDKDATADDYVKGALGSAAAFVGLPLAAHGLGKFAGLATRSVADVAGPKLTKVADDLQKYARSAADEGGLERAFNREADRPYKQLTITKGNATLLERAAGTLSQGIRRVLGAKEELMVSWIDKNYSLNRYRAMYRAITGKELPNVSDMFTRESADADLAFSRQFEELGAKIRSLMPTADATAFPKAIEWSQLIDAIVRSKGGLGTDAEAFADGDIMRRVLRFRKDNADMMPTIEKAAREIQKYFRKNLEDVFFDDSEGLARIIKKHPWYMPREIDKDTGSEFAKLWDDVPEAKQFSQKGSRGAGSLDLKRAKGTDAPAEVADIFTLSNYGQMMQRNAAKRRNVKLYMDMVRDVAEQTGHVPLWTSEMDKARRSLLAGMSDVAQSTKLLLKDKDKWATVEKNLAKKAAALSAKIEGYAFGFKEVFEPGILDGIGDKDFDAKIMSIMRKSAKAKERLEKALTEKTGVSSAIDSLQESVDALAEAGKDIRGRLKTLGSGEAIRSDKVPKGMMQFLHLNKGVKERWLVPEDVGMIISNMDTRAVASVKGMLNDNMFGKLATGTANVFAELTVRKYPIFMLWKNFVRDGQDSAAYAGANAFDLGKSLVQSMKGRMLKPDETEELIRSQGVFMEMLRQRNETPEQATVKLLRKMDFFDEKTNKALGVKKPSFLSMLAEAEEMAPRRATFMKGIENGMTPAEAAELAASSHVNFRKSGSYGEQLNRVVPFFNATTQGLYNYLNKAVTNPYKFYSRMLWTIAPPLAYVHAHNSKFSSYDNIPFDDRLRNWVWIVDEFEGKTPDGKRTMIPEYITVPVGPSLAPVKGLLEFTLMSEKRRDEIGYRRLADSIVGGMSPLTASKWPVPPALRIAYETRSNYSEFKKGPIVTPWVFHDGHWYQSDKINDYEKYSDSTTTEFAKILGKWRDWSPAKIDYVLKQGLLGDIVRAMDLPILVTRKGFKKTAEDLSEPEDYTKLPFVRSFVKTSNIGEYYIRKEAELEETKAQTQKKIDRRRAKAEEKETP